MIDIVWMWFRNYHLIIFSVIAIQDYEHLKTYEIY